MLLVLDLNQRHWAPPGERWPARLKLRRPQRRLPFCRKLPNSSTWATTSLIAIGLLPAVVLYFILALVEFKGAANSFILVASLVASAFWLRWLEKRGYATIVLPLVPIKLYYVVVIGIVLSMFGALREVLLS